MTESASPPVDAGDALSGLTTAVVSKIAGLAKLRLSEGELEEFTRQLSDILVHARDLEAFDLSGVEALAHPLALVNVFREDEIGPLLDRGDVLACAPAAEDGQFRVPPVLGEAV